MRLSVKKGDIGYSPRWAIKAKAILDGKEVKNCFTADEERGKVWCHDIDAFLPGMESIPVKEMAGNVEIKLCRTF